MSRILALLALVALAATIFVVAKTSGFPDTYWTVFGFFHDTLGLSEHDAATWTDAVRKSFHVPAYALLAALTWWMLAQRHRRVWTVLLVVVLVGVADELIQSRQPGRTARVTDLLVDMAGALIGLWAVGAFRRTPTEA